MRHCERETNRIIFVFDPAQRNCGLHVNCPLVVVNKLKFGHSLSLALLCHGENSPEMDLCFHLLPH